MSKLAKALTAAAGNAGAGALYVEDVFSTYLYDGNSSTQTIANDIDLDGEGGLVWIKARDIGYSHYFFDTERGAGNYLRGIWCLADFSGLAISIRSPRHRHHINQRRLTRGDIQHARGEPSGDPE